MVIEHDVPDVPDRQVQPADGFLDLPGSRVAAHQGADPPVPAAAATGVDRGGPEPVPARLDRLLAHRDGPGALGPVQPAAQDQQAVGMRER
jgi:hypothetical protein